jgi:phosphoribosylformylglycinamidine synthase subunit PurQ / glutaminase
MKEIRTIILRAPGTNCELETQAVFQLAGTTAEIVLLSSLLKNPKYLKEFQILILAWGFFVW